MLPIYPSICILITYKYTIHTLHYTTYYQEMLLQATPLPSSHKWSSSCSTFVPRTVCPSFHIELNNNSKKRVPSRRRRRRIEGSLIETTSPVVLWAGRVCIHYALLKTGLAGSPANPLVSSGPLLPFSFCVFIIIYLWPLIVCLFVVIYGVVLYICV